MIGQDDFDLMVKSKKAVKKTNITRLSVSSTTNSAPDSGVDRSSSDLKELKRKKAVGKTTSNNTRLSISSTNDSVPDGDSGADRSNSSSDSDDDESDDYHENEREEEEGCHLS